MIAATAQHGMAAVARDLMLAVRSPLTPNLGLMLDHAAEAHPGQELIVDRPADVDPTWPTLGTSAEWAQHVAEASGWLYEAGVRRGDRVVVMKANHPDILILSYAACRIGAVPVQLSSTLDPLRAQTLLERLHRPFLVTDPERIAACELDHDTLARLCRSTIVVGGEAPGAVALDDLRGLSSPPPNPVADHELMIMTHTSGTTGIPKLVMHSADTLRLLALPELQPWPVLGIRADDVVAMCDPFFHARLTTALMTATTLGTKLVFISKPEVAHVRALLVEHRPTVLEAIPNAFLHMEALADDPARPLRDVRLFGNCFDAIHQRTVRKFLAASDRRVPLWLQTWGQSEVGMISASLYTRRLVRARGERQPATQRVGWPVPVVSHLRAVDPSTGRPVPRGEVGLIEVDQPGRCLGYWGEMDRWQNKASGRWWNTGDLGTIGRSGLVRLVDREVDRIPGASGLELEDVLLDRLPTATEVVILAIPDALPLPVLSTVDDVPVGDAEWAAATADLPPLDARAHVAWDDIPRTATWKVQRSVLRERLRPGAQPVGTGRWT